MNTDAKYNLLISTIDELARNAPDNLSVYHSDLNDVDAEIHKRSRAFIHLFLRTRFGLLDFAEAESRIPDGPDDGGLDAYHIDEEDKKIYLIQSKFSTSAERFEE